MRVAFLADPLYYPLAGGTTRYIVELVKHLSCVDGVDLQPFSLHRPEVIAQAVRERHLISAESIPSAVPRPLQYLLWHALGWSGPTKSVMEAADVVHTPVLMVPPRRRRPLVVTALDLSFLCFPQYHTLRTRLVAQSGLRRAAREADAFIAISEHTAQDLVQIGRVNRERIAVVPLAADERFVPATEAVCAEVQERYGIDAPYALYVGTLEPRKNLVTLLQAFAGLGEEGVKLVLVGKKGWMYEEIFAALTRLELADRVIVPGFVANEDLPALYSGASVFVYPSHYEGFGLPVLEAMQCGAPVVTTNASSLPEVAGDAALMVSPDDVAGLTAMLKRALCEPGLREDMRGKGFEQAARFSWRKTAEMTAEVYRQVL